MLWASNMRIQHLLTMKVDNKKEIHTLTHAAAGNRGPVSEFYLGIDVD